MASRKRRRRTRRRRRTQRGGKLFANFSLPAGKYAVPPGGHYEPGCTNGLRGGKYYGYNMGQLSLPKSTVGNMYPGFHKQMKKLVKGGRRRRKRSRRRRSRRRRSRRRRRRSRRRRRRRQRGGAGVGSSISKPPLKQITNNLLVKGRMFVPPGVKNALRGGSTYLQNIKHGYNGERTEVGANPMNQPIRNLKAHIDSLDSLDDISKPEGFGGWPGKKK